MTSKISCINLIRKDIHHRGWIFLINCVLLFLVMPVYTAMRLEVLLNSADSFAESPIYLLDQASMIFPGMISGYYNMLLFISIPLLAVLNAVSGFSYIHSRKKQDFYHALPVKRSLWYIVESLSGLCMFLFPYLICIFSMFMIAGARGILSSLVLQSCIFAALRGIMAYCVLFFTAVLACMLTGNLIASFLALLVISVYPSLFFELIPLLKSQFFKTYFEEGSSLFQNIGYHISPAMIFRTLINTSESYRLSISVLSVSAIMLILLAAGSFLIYRVYPAQSAGRSLSFPKTAPAIKLLISVPGALFISFLVQNFTGVSGKEWIIAISLLAVILLCAVIEFIYEQDLLLILKHWKTTLASVAAVSAVLLWFGLDLSGYDTWLPEEDRIESVAFYPYSFSNYFQYPDTIYSASSFFENAVYTDNISVLYTLAEEGISNLETGNENTTADNLINVFFNYQLSDGKSVYRKYTVSRQSSLNALEKLCRDENYRKELFPVFKLDRSSIRDIEISDLYGMKEKLSLSASEISEFLDAYEKDILAADIRTMDKTVPAGELTVYIPDPYIAGTDSAVLYGSAVSAPYKDAALFPLSSLYIYPDYANTLNYLQQKNITLRTEFNPDDVTGITLYLSAPFTQSDLYKQMKEQLSSQVQFRFHSETDCTVNISSRNDIKLILDFLHPNTSYLLGDSERGTNSSADVSLEDGTVVSGFFIG